MKTRRFLIYVVILLCIGWTHQIYSVWWPQYKQMRWEASPMYQMQQHFAQLETLREKAGQKYILNFKDKCKKFGEDMKLLKSIENDPNFDEPFKNHLRLQLYYRQFVLFEQWLTYDRLLFPYGYDLSISFHYYKDIKPRSI